jgi:hypothetical protein
MAGAVEHVVEQVLRDEQHDERQPAGLPREEPSVFVDIRIDGNHGEPRQLVRALVHERERGVA